MFLSSYPSRHGGVDPLFELRVCGEAVPHDVRGVVLVSQLRAALKQEVYDKEFDAAIQTWSAGEKERSQLAPNAANGDSKKEPSIVDKQVSF